MPARKAGRVLSGERGRMEKLILTEPTEEYLEQIKAFREEFAGMLD